MKVHTSHANAARRKRIALVIANPAVSTTTGWPVGFWWSELTHPYYAFHEAGYEVEVFSPAGGRCVPDAMSDPRDPSGYSASDLVSMGFLHTPSLAALVDTDAFARAARADEYSHIRWVLGRAMGPSERAASSGCSCAVWRATTA